MYCTEKSAKHCLIYNPNLAFSKLNKRDRLRAVDFTLQHFTIFQSEGPVYPAALHPHLKTDAMKLKKFIYR